MVFFWGVFAFFYFFPSNGVFASEYEKVYDWAPGSYDPSYRKSTSSENRPLRGASPPEISLAHDRANEIRSLMAAYAKGKINLVENVLLDPNRFDLLQQTVSPYCTKQELENARSGIQSCANRYLQIQRALIYKLKRGLDEGNNSRAELSCTQRREDGSCVGKDSAMVVSRIDLKNEAQTFLPYLPSYRDLQEFAKKNTVSRPVSSAEYQEWVRHAFDKNDQDEWYQKNIALEPIKEDFLIMKTYPQDPLNPDLGTLTVIEKDLNGNPKYDERAFKRAYEEWLFNKKEMKEALMGEKKRERIPPSTDSNDIDAFIYAQSRGVLVDGANQVVPHLSPSPSSFVKTGQASKNLKSKRQQNTKEDASQKRYTGEEKVDPAYLHGGSKEKNVQQSEEYDSDSFSVDAILGPDTPP